MHMEYGRPKSAPVSTWNVPMNIWHNQLMNHRIVTRRIHWQQQKCTL